MRIDLDNLPSDASVLHRLVREMAAVVEHRDGEIERLRLIIRQLQRAQFGRRSERLDPDQFALALDDLTADLAAAAANQGGMVSTGELNASMQTRRGPLPEHLEREDIVLDVANETCACCIEIDSNTVERAIRPIALN